MSLWFHNKHSSLSTEHPSSDFALSKLFEDARCLFNQRHLNFTVSEMSLLSAESIATREWITTALRSTTGQDRIFAMAYLINTYPLCSLKYLDSVIVLIVPAKHRDCSRAIEVAHQLFARTLLPPDRELVPFNRRPVNLPESCRSEVLCLWYFEDQLKRKYLRFVKALEQLLMSDTAESFKRKALNALSDLAVKATENREIIFGIIVNKLGDRSKIIASCCIHRLRMLIKKRPQLTDAVVHEIRSFLFRPNLPARAKHYAVVLLSCLQLTDRASKFHGKASHDLPVVLVKIYTAFFNAELSDELPEKLLAALLTGLNRAIPFIPDERFDEISVEIDNIFRLVHRSEFTVSLQALSVLLQLSNFRANIQSRYFQALYRKLKDPEILSSSRGPSLLHLLYRSMLHDTETDRLRAFSQRLLELCLIHPHPGFVVGSLILLSKVQAIKKQALVLDQTPMESHSMLPHDNIPPTSLLGDDDEYFSDASDSESDEFGRSEKKAVVGNPLPVKPAVVSWEHKKLIKLRNVTKHANYNPDGREPMFACVGAQPSWPLPLLTAHAHPTVALFASDLLLGHTVLYTGDPFEDFSRSHFFDRFSYKKPKTNSIVKYRALPGRVLQRKTGINSGSRSLSVNSTLFRQMPFDRVATDERFFHSYFTFMESRTKTTKTVPKDGHTSGDSISDDEFDAYLEKYEHGLVPQDDELDDEVDLALGEDFSMDSDLDSRLESEDETQPHAMNRIQAAHLSKNTEGMRGYNEFGGDDSHSDMSSDNPDEYAVNKPANMTELFASADDVGYLYGTCETKKERKQRRREGKCAIQPRFRNKINSKRSILSTQRRYGRKMRAPYQL